MSQCYKKQCPAFLPNTAPFLREDAAKAKLPLAFGVRGDSLTIQVKVEKNKKGGQELSLKFADED